MPFAAGTPTAPWTTAVTGSGTWDELVAFINDPTKLQKVGSTYTLKGGLMLEVLGTLSPLESSTVIWQGGASWSLGNGGQATFGKSVTNATGVVYYVNGCTLVEDTDAWARGADNYNNQNTWVRTGGKVFLYDSTIMIRQAGGASHFDIKSGGYFTARNSKLIVDSSSDSYNHLAGVLDIDGFAAIHANDNAGSLLELIATASVTKLANFTPFLNNPNARQCTLYPATLVLDQWGGETFASWFANDYHRLTNPKAYALKKVDNPTTAASSFEAEQRTVQVSALAGPNPLAGVQIDILNKTNWYEGGGLSSASGVYSQLVTRGNWEGGGGTPTYSAYQVERTPHMVYARKWGYRTVAQQVNMIPSAWGEAQKSVVAAMVVDPLITLSSTAAAAITGVSLTYHSAPVNWNGKDWSITITADPATKTLSDIYHSVAYQASELTSFRRRNRAYWSGSNWGWETDFASAGLTGGVSDKTIVMVGSSAFEQAVPSNQVLAGLGQTAVNNGLAIRSSTVFGQTISSISNGNWTDKFNAASDSIPSKSFFRNPCVGKQIVIMAVTWNAATNTLRYVANNIDFGTATVSAIDFGAAASAFFGIAHVGGRGSWWAISAAQAFEGFVFDRVLSDAEISRMTYHLAHKWNVPSIGQLNTNNGFQQPLAVGNYPLNPDGSEWTPANFASDQGPKVWYDISDPTAITVNGSNQLAGIKNKANGVAFVNGTTSGSVVAKFNEVILPQLLDSLTTTVRGQYPEGRYRGVRVVTPSGDPFPGFEAMQADDGSFYVPPVLAKLSLTGIRPGSEVRLLVHGTQTEVAGAESVDNGLFEHFYSYTSPTYVDIAVFALGYQPIWLDNVLLGASNSSIPIQQIIDRQYLNP